MLKTSEESQGVADMAGAITVEQTEIPGLLVVRMPVHADDRGWFKENWQREKMLAAGVPDFAPVQNNVSYNHKRGVVRGMHTEPWDKFVAISDGRIYGAWVDLREGPSFGATVHFEMGPETAVYVPRGVSNGYQCLTDNVTYTYLVTEHWRPNQGYPALDLADPTVAIPWPIPLAESILSEKDRANPALDDVVPMPPKRTLILGGDGQLGRALAAALPEAEAVGRDVLDISDTAALEAWPWQQYGTVINAAAFTDVDGAESLAGRRQAWEVNAAAPATLARLSRSLGFTLVHVSTDYVFDGDLDGEHQEDALMAPLGVYAQTKAAGDLAVSTAPRHYLIRTSWVVGDGRNFVRTMASLAERGVSPTVVDDQRGRLTFADELARAITHLVASGAPYGLYNVTNAGPVVSWFDVARRVFELSGRPADDVSPTSTAEYSAGKDMAPRPHNSAMSLERIRSTGFEPEDAWTALERYCG